MMKRLVKKSLKKGYRYEKNGDNIFRQLYSVVSNDNKVRLEEGNAIETFFDKELNDWSEKPIPFLTIYYNNKVVGQICGENNKYSTDAETFCKQLGV